MKKKNLVAQSLVQIKNIKDGIIETDAGEYLRLVEVDPINFHLRSISERNQIIYNFASWIKIAPVSLQFKVVSTPTDIQAYISRLNDNLSNEKNEYCRRLIRDYIRLISQVGLKESVSRRFFLVLRYTKQGLFGNDYNAIANSLNTIYTQFKSYIKQCGNKIIEHLDEDVFALEAYYSIYNRNSNKTAADRVQDIVNYQINRGIENPTINVKDVLAPYSMQTFKDYIVLNGNTYISYLYIPSEKYRTSVHAAWLSGLINMGEGVDIDLFFQKQNNAKIINSLGRNIRINRARVKDTSDTNTDFDELMNSIDGGKYIKDCIQSGEDFYYMNLLITVSANSLEVLNYKIDFIQNYLRSKDMDARIANYHMMEAYQSCVPLGDLSKSISDRGNRNVLTYGVASTYLFTSFELSDPNGILLGINDQNNSLCILDLFDTSKYKNANLAILGTTGAGKTYLLQMMALRMRMNDIQTFIIAPFKGREFKRACKSIGGEFISIAPGSENCINVLDIRPEDNVATDLIDDEDTFKTVSLLSKKIQDLAGFFKLLVPDITNEEAQLLDNALIQAYAEKGITTDNETLIDAEKTLQAGKKVFKEMPLLEDVYNVLKESQETKRLANIIDRFVHGSASSFNRHTNVNLENKYIVVDISMFPEELLPIGMFIALDFIYSKAKEDITKKKTIIIDEAWRLIGAGSNDYAAKYVLEIFKIIRGYGGSAVVATQDIHDFFARKNGEYGRGIIANSKTKILLQLEKKEAETAKDIFDLSQREVMDVMKFERGHGLLITNSNNIPVSFKSTKHENELITTDRAQLEKLYNEKRSNN